MKLRIATLLLALSPFAFAQMRIEEFQQFALSANPTLRQAAALVNRSSGLARQAGLYPNPSIGYQGDQIRGGSYGGGEQGAYVQQTFVLGGKLGLRRDVFEQQRRTRSEFPSSGIECSARSARASIPLSPLRK